MNFKLTTTEILHIANYCHGAGIDLLWHIKALTDSAGNPTAWECRNSWHAMNDHGYYVGYLNFVVKIDRDGEIDVSVDEKMRDIMERENVDEDDGESLINLDIEDHIHESWTCATEHIKTLHKSGTLDPKSDAEPDECNFGNFGNFGNVSELEFL